MEYENAKKHIRATARAVHKRKICDDGFNNFCILREDEMTENGAEMYLGLKTLMLHMC